MDFEKPKKEYHITNNMVYSCQYHVVWCPKYRRKVLVDDIAKRMKEIILDLQGRLYFRVLDMEIMPDHVHLLLDVHPNVGIYKTINQIKGTTSCLLRREFPKLRSRLPTLWTRSKFISTVGAVSLDTVVKYIENQRLEGKHGTEMTLFE